jgi:hypothetical protein
LFAPAFCVVIGTASAYPVIHLGQLKFPQSPYTMRRQAFAFTPAVNGVFYNAQMPGDVKCGNPRFGIHGIDDLIDA